MKYFTLLLCIILLLPINAISAGLKLSQLPSTTYAPATDSAVIVRQGATTDYIAPLPIGSSSTLGLVQCGSGTTCTDGVISANATSSGTSYVDPRNYGAQCSGYYGMATVTISNGGSGYNVGDTFKTSHGIAARVATGVVTAVSGGVVTAATITYPGEAYYVGSTYSTAATSGTGTGLTVTVATLDPGFDDTAGILAATIVAQAMGSSVQAVNGCWFTSVQPPSGTSIRGQGWAPNYGYDYGSNGLPFTAPIWYGIGAPARGINTSSRENISLSGFEINYFYSGSAFGNTACVGSSSGSSGFGGKIWFDYMSFKGCANGTKFSGGIVYLVSRNTDYSANGTGLSGTLSDLFSDGDTFTSNNNAAADLSGGSAFFRISNARVEYEQKGFILGGGGVEVNMDNNQFDHFATCAICLNGNWNAINITGGGIKAGGLAGSLTVTNATNNGSGLIRLTVTSANSTLGGTPTSGLSTGNTITVSGVGGTTEANGNWTLTVIDSTHIDLQGSSFVNAYTSGGFGGVWGKDADINLSSTGTGIGLTMSNVGFYSATSLGQAAAPAYIMDATTSHNDYIELIGGYAYPASVTTAAGESFSIGVANWESFGQPAHYTQMITGSPWVITGNSVFNIQPTGVVGIGTLSPNANSILDMSGTPAAQSAFILPQNTTATRPTAATGMLRYNTTSSTLEFYNGSAWVTVAGNPVVAGSLGGLTLSNDGATPNTVVDIAAGAAASSDNTVTISIGSPLTKSLASIWTVGTGNGCLDTGSIGASTWYHLFVIERLDTGVSDVLCSTSASSPTLPTSYTVFRRIGSIKTDGSSHILAFVQNGSTFWWTTPTLDVNTATLGATAALESLNVPPGVQVTPICRYSISNAGNSVILTSGDEADSAPGNALPIASAPGQDMTDESLVAGLANLSCPYLITNTSGQIRARASASSTTLSIVTRGYID